MKRTKNDFKNMIKRLQRESLSPTELEVFRKALPEEHVDREKREPSPTNPFHEHIFDDIQIT